MAITAYPFDDQDTTESQFSAWASELQDSGVADNYGGNGFRVTGGAGGMSVQVQPGLALLRGHALVSTAVETVAIPAAATAQRYDRIVLRINPATNLGAIAVLQGTPGTGLLPGLTQTAEGIFEIALAYVSVPANATTIDAANVVVERRYVGSRVGVWWNLTRPTNPLRISRLGYNMSTGTWEFFNGAGWQNLLPSTVENSVQWNGYELIVSTSQPAATPLANRIWIQPTT